MLSSFTTRRHEGALGGLKQCESDWLRPPGIMRYLPAVTNHVQKARQPPP